MKRLDYMILAATAAVTLAVSGCWPGDVSVGLDTGYDVSPGYFSIGPTVPIGVTSPWWGDPYPGPVYVPQPLAPRPIGGGAIAPPTRPVPGPVVPGNRPGIGSNPGPVILPDNRPVEAGPVMGNPQRPGSRR